MKRIDLIGKRFGRLIVNSYAGKGKWECFCDCGNKSIVYGQDLREGKTRSCRCLSLGRGYSDKLMSSKNILFSSYKNHAKNRAIPMLLSFEEFISIIKQDCHYCGQKPDQYVRSMAIKRKFLQGFPYNGIDRLDNTKGYQLNNVAPCCKRCNISKWDRNEIDFIKWVKQCYENMERKGLI
jgi:hypothetical protein